ncbi:MAG: metal-dependent transcriptional regulator [Dehalococcoidales bacterium]|nr:metal-dependent transcriptional regulator [Dehalococcoidales bacterium]
MDSERTEEYLEAIYKEQIKGGAASTSFLARDLGVSQPAVTDMLKNLESKGLIDYISSKGATLTDIGVERALGVIRRHRLWERFLTDVLGMTWDKVHEVACKLEHLDVPEVEERLAFILGDADTCPHGHSIPDQKGNVKEEKTVPLTSFQPLQRVNIIAIDEHDSGLLRDIEKRGLKPQVVVTILKKNENGSLELEAGKKRIRLSAELSAILLAEPAPIYQPDVVKKEMPLSKLSAGHSGILKEYTGGRGLLGRCLSLGFTPGSVIKMLENFNSGPVLVKVHDTEIALGRGLAEQIIVTRNETA